MSPPLTFWSFEPDKQLFWHLFGLNSFRIVLNSVLQLVPTGMAANLRKRRGVVRASITRLVKRLEDLETAPDRPDVSSSAKQLAVKLEVLDTDYKALHLQLIDLIDEETEEMDQEQVNLDKHDSLVWRLYLQLQTKL